ncbi:integral membrane protein [Paenibacillus sp. Aloe-11]|nr:integral membrane protein [Paenibacillus sp. Aloe-11]
MRKEVSLADEPVLKLILKLAPPVMLALLIQSLYNIVDSWFVSRYSEHGLTALSLIFPIQLLMIALATGSGVGTNALISRFLGANDKQSAQNTAFNGLLLAVVNWILFMLAGLLLLRPYFEMSTSTPDVLVYGLSFGKVILLFSFGIFIESHCTKVLQASGNMVTPMIAQVTGAVINCVLDPIFIFGWGFIPSFGVEGAAIATVTGQITAMFITIFAATKKGKIKFRNRKANLRIMSNIYSAGAPSMIMQSLFTIYIVGLNLILASFTENAVTVLGIYYKIQTFFFVPLMGLDQAILPIISFNYGAGKPKRMWDTLKYANGIGVLLMSLGTAIFCFLPEQLLRIFTSNPDIIEIGVPAFRIIGASFIPAAFTLITPTFFQATSRGFRSISVTILRQVILLVPLAWLFSHKGLFWTWLTFPCTEVITMVISFLLLSKFKKQHITANMPIYIQKN